MCYVGVYGRASMARPLDEMMTCEIFSISTYFQLLSNLFANRLFELLEPVGQTRLGQIFIEIFMAEFIENGIFDVLVLHNGKTRETKKRTLKYEK